MNSLKIPESGVMLRSAPGEEYDPLPQQAFTISLSDNVIESMIKRVQAGGELQLALGATPTLHYGTRSHRIAPPSDHRPCDLYLTQPYNSLREGTQIPAMSLFQNPKLNKMPPKAREAAGSATKPKMQSGNHSSASSFDSDIEALQNGIAADEAAKESAKSVLLSGPLDPKKAAKAKNKLSWGNSNNARSLSTSPALKPSSPAINPTQSSVERLKQQRIPLIHELAIREQSLDHLQKKWNSKPEDFRTVLDKVADYNPSTKLYALRKVFWKELDVWNYDYDRDEDRDQVVKNAIKHYDRLRLSASDPEWERLNPKEDRGKGICLSKLQSKINKAQAQTPTIKVQKADDGSGSKDEAETERGGSQKSEAMSRSSSNPLPKTKKSTSSEAQAKRLLNNKAKAAPKTSPSKGKTGRDGRQPLSQEFIENSDSSGDEAPATKPEPPKKPIASKVEKAAAAKPVAKSVEKPKPTARQAEKPAAKPAKAVPVHQKPVSKPAPKRQLEEEEDDSSSSSGTPLSKRIRPKQPLPSQSLKKRPLPLDGRQAPRDAGPSTTKAKNTSPTKSSPLASSPPTNVSDMSDGVGASRKRKAEQEARAPPAKRQAADHVPSEVISQAQKFKAKYSEYEALHREMSSLDDPPEEKLANLRYMREKLAKMKAQIYKNYRG